MTSLRRLNVILHQIKKLECHYSSSVISTADVLSTRKQVQVLDSHISYLDTGGTKPVVLFLHGNPTSSYLWRNIIPEVAPVARCLAPDLIGMGKSGKNPTGSYKFVDHYKYLSAWIDCMNFSGKLNFVIHDWGSGLGFHWANEHRDKVQTITHMESIAGPIANWDLWPDVARKIFQAMRTPAGEEIVLKKNMFVERLLPGSVLRGLTKEEMAVYREPYLEEGESRRPTLTWPREIPIVTDGPADVVAIAQAYNEWLSQSKDLPKLYINADPGFFSPQLKKMVAGWPNQKTVTVPGVHFLQEDSPQQIGKAIHEFLSDIFN